MRHGNEFIGWFVKEAPEPEFRMTLTAELDANGNGTLQLPAEWLASTTLTVIHSALSADRPAIISAAVENNTVRVQAFGGLTDRAKITLSGLPRAPWRRPRWPRYSAETAAANRKFWKSAHGKA